MRVIYIAGPFRGPNAWAIEQNIRRAETLALEAWTLGAAVICPHSNTRFYQGVLHDDVWLKGDLAILRRCDAILMAPHWEDSSGAREERDLALSMGLPVFYHHDLKALASWIRFESFGDEEAKAREALESGRAA